MVRNVLTGQSRSSKSLHKPKPTGVSKVKALKKVHSSVRDVVAKSIERKEQAAAALLDPTLQPRPPPPPREVERRIIGRAVVLAHGAGGSSSHASMKAWRTRLQDMCDEVFMIDFPRPCTIASGAAAYIDAIRRARKSGHPRVVLIGVGTGAKTALHLLSGVASDDDGAPDASEAEAAPEMPPKLRSAVVGMVALSYPLMRTGSSTPRDAPLRALPEDAPPVLLVCGSKDPHTDAAQLSTARSTWSAPTQVHIVDGGDAALRVAVGTSAERDAHAALDNALTDFLTATLGSQEGFSRVVEIEPAPKMKKAKRSASADGASDSGGVLSSQDLAALAPGISAVEMKKLEKQEKKEEEQRLLSKKAAEAEAAQAARAAKAAKSAGTTTPEAIVLRGCGTAAINGTYLVDGTRDDAPSYRKAAGEGGPSFTIERDSAPDQATQWCLCVDYGFVSWIFVDSDSLLPPASGWQLGDECEGPPPTLMAAAGSPTALPPEPVVAEEEDDDEEEAPAEKQGFAETKKHKKKTTGHKLSRGIKNKINAQKRSGKR